MPKSLFATLLIPPPEKALDREAAIGWLTHKLPDYESLAAHLLRRLLQELEEGTSTDAKPGTSRGPSTWSDPPQENLAAPCHMPPVGATYRMERGAGALRGPPYPHGDNPRRGETDACGALFDDWETGGLDVDLDGTVDVLLPGADPNRKDLFLELDCLAKDGNGNGSLGDPTDHTHCPRQNAIIDTVQAFANAPVTNPDGTLGIQLHIDTGPLYGAGTVFNVVGVGGVTGTYGDLGGGGDQIDIIGVANADLTADDFIFP